MPRTDRPDDVTLVQCRLTLDALQAHGGYREAAAVLGLGKSTLHERIARLRELAARMRDFDGNVQPEPEVLAPVADPQAPANDDPGQKPAPYRLGGTAADREVTKLKDENRRLRASLEECHREQLGEDEVRRMLGSLSEAPHDPPPWLCGRPQKHATRSPETLVTCWSDWHLGEVVSREETAGVNEYSLEIARQRFWRVVESTIEVAREHGPGGRGTPYSGAVVNVVGDLVSGGLHPELVKTDEESLLQSILSARDMLVQGLTRMADEFGRVYAPAVAGNHGRTTRKPEFKGYVHTNADWLIYELTKRHFEGLGDTRVVLDTRRSNDVYYKVHAHRYMLTHGDMLGVKGGDGIIGALGPIARGEIKFRGAAMSAGQEYDTLVMGHWHQQLWLPRAIVSNTLKGYDEYARLSLRAPISKPSQPLWFHHPRRGVTSKWDIQADEATGTRSPAEWVSWSGAAA